MFDVSTKSATDFSPNNVLKNGPQIQDDLFIILIRFQQRSIVLITDINKMIGQINLENWQNLKQSIVWISDPKSDLQFYRYCHIRN